MLSKPIPVPFRLGAQVTSNMFFTGSLRGIPYMINSKIIFLISTLVNLSNTPSHPKNKNLSFSVKVFITTSGCPEMSYSSYFMFLFLL